METRPSLPVPFPVNGFYEWQAVEGQKAKQPWFIRLPDQALFALGGLWDRSHDDDGSAVESATIVTMPANDLLAEIHNTKQRMPLVIPPEAFADWLGPDAAAAQDRIAAFPASRMQAWPVSTYVNKPANDDQRCIASTDP